VIERDLHDGTLHPFRVMPLPSGRHKVVHEALGLTVVDAVGRKGLLLG